MENKPKIVFSYVELKPHKGFQWMCTKKQQELVVKKAELSLKFVKQHEYKTVLFVDKKSLKLFQHLPYDEFRIVKSSLTKKISQHYWSLGKLYAYSEMKEPFVHIDFDVFMFEDFLKPYISWPYFAFDKEKWTKNLTSPTVHIFEKYLPQLEKYEIRYSHNCSVLGGTNYKAINQAAQETITLIKKYQKQFITHAETNFVAKYKTEGILPWYLALLFEQIIFIYLLMVNQNLLELPTIAGTKDSIDDSIKDFKKLNMFHLWGDEMKNVIETCFGQMTFLNMLESNFLKKCS